MLRYLNFILINRFIFNFKKICDEFEKSKIRQRLSGQIDRLKNHDSSKNVYQEKVNNLKL